MKKILLLLFTFFVVVILVISTAFAGNIPQDKLDAIKENVRTQVRTKTAALRVLIINGYANHSPEVEAARSELRSAEDALRAIYSKDYRQKISGMDKGAAFGVMWPQFAQAKAEFERVRAPQIFSALDNYLSSNPSAADKAKHFGLFEGTFRSYRIGIETAYAMLCTLSPIITEDEDGFRAGTTNRAVIRMKDLSDELVSLDIGNAPDQDGITRETWRWYLNIRQEYDLEEYRRLSATAVFVDPKVDPNAPPPDPNAPDQILNPGDSKTALHGTVRQQIALDAEFALAARFSDNSRKLPIAKLFWGDDSRDQIAAQLNAEAISTPMFQMLHFLQDGINPEPKQFFLAAAAVMRFQQQQVHDWWVNAYNGGDNAHWWNTNLGMLLRANDAAGTGDAGQSEVAQRISQFNSETGAAANALTLAANTPDPNNLPQDVSDLLKNYGYIFEGTGDQNNKYYQIPDNSQGLSDAINSSVQRLGLPGESWLAIVSPKTIGIAIASTLAPELFTAELEALAVSAGASDETILAVKVISNLVAGTVTGATNDYLDNGKVDVKKTLIENVLLGSILQGINHQLETITPPLAKLISDCKTGSRLYAFFTRTDGAAFKDKAERWVYDALSLAADGVVNGFYQSEMQGKIEPEIFLTVLFNSVITRQISAEYHLSTPTAVFIQFEEFMNWIGKKLPPEFQKLLTDQPELAHEVFDRSMAQFNNQWEAMKRLGKVTDGGRELLSGKIFLALVRGEISFNDLRVAVEANSSKYRQVVSEVRNLRESFFKHLADKALIHARAVLDYGFDQDLAAIANDKTLTPEQAKKQTDELTARYMSDLEKLNAKIIAPGSGDPTSDIDRSVQSPLLRKTLVRLYESYARSLDGGLIPPSARSFDVNEYFNIFPFVDTNLTIREALNAQTVTALPKGLEGPLFPPSPEGMTQAEGLRAQTYSGSLFHLDPVRERGVFQDNVRNKLIAKLDSQHAPPDVRDKALALLQKQFDYANQSLAFGEASIKAEITAMKLDPKLPDSELRARESLYNKRLLKIRNVLFDIERSGSPNATVADRAGVEQAMAFFLREGIETYNDYTGLDIIVTRSQAKDAKGNSRSLESFITDPDFTIQKQLNSYNADSIDGMIFDQYHLLMEHVHAYRMGHELPWMAGRAMAKYIGRALLGMHIQGLDFVDLVKNQPPNEPRRWLYEKTIELINVKADPKAFKEKLTSMSEHSPVSPDQGIRTYLQRAEIVFPELKGLLGLEVFEGHGDSLIPTEWKPKMGDPNSKFQSLSRNQRYIKVEPRHRLNQIRAYAGSDAAGLIANDDLQQAIVDLAEVKKRISDLERLALNYREIDWDKVLTLEDQIHGLDLLLENEPSASPTDSNWSNLTQKKQDLQNQLDALKSQFDGKPIDLQMVTEYRTLWLRRYQLESDMAELKVVIKKFQDAAAIEMRLDQLDLTGSWEFGPTPDRPGKVRIEQTGDHQIKLSITWAPKDQNAKPDYEVTGTVHRGKILAWWKDLVTIKPAVNGNAANVQFLGGAFRAQVTDAGDAIEIEQEQTTPPKREGLRWNPGTLYKAPNIHAPTTTQYFESTTTQVPQTNSGGGGGGPMDGGTDGFGRLYVYQPTSSGAMWDADFDVYAPGYKPGGKGFVSSGRGGTGLPVGTYDIVVHNKVDFVIRNVGIASKYNTVTQAPQNGVVTLHHLMPDGSEVPASTLPSEYGRLYGRIYSGKTPLDLLTTRERLEMPPGDYMVAFGDHKYNFSVQSGVETSIKIHSGGIALKSIDGLGKPLGIERIQLYLAQNREIPIASSLVYSSSDKSAGTAVVPPGTYDIKLAFKVGIASREVWKKNVQVFACESTPITVGLGSLKVTFSGQAPAKGYIHVKDNDTNMYAQIINLPQTEPTEVLPGVFELTASGFGLMPEKKTVEIKEGQTATIEFQGLP